MWRHRCAGERAHTSIDTGPSLLIRLFRETAPFSHLLRHAGDTKDTLPLVRKFMHFTAKRPNHRHDITMIYDTRNHSQAPTKRPDTNLLRSSPKSAPSKIKTQRNGITCMHLTSLNWAFSKTIHDQLRPLPRSSSRAVLYAFSSKQAPITVMWAFSDLHL